MGLSLNASFSSPTLSPQAISQDDLRIVAWWTTLSLNAKSLDTIDTHMCTLWWVGTLDFKPFGSDF